jgi:hypothetical protein
MADYAVTVAGAGDNSGTNGGVADWSNAMDLAAWVAAMPGAAAGDEFFMYSDGDDVYTLGADLNCANDGTKTNPIKVTGVSDQGSPPTIATGSARPTINCPGFILNCDNYWYFQGLQGTGTDTSVFRADRGSIFRDCKVTNTSGTGGRNAIYIGGYYALALDCECVSTAGYGILCAANTRVIGCYVHDSDIGIGMGATTNVFVANTIIDTCATAGVEHTGSGEALTLLNVTIYNCVTGIDAASLADSLVLNTIVSDCATAAGTWAAEQYTNISDYSDYYNSSTTTNLTKGDNDQTVDPGFVDAANGDFRIGTALRVGGWPGVFPGGLSTGYIDIGAVQRIEPPAVGQGLHSIGVGT